MRSIFLFISLICNFQKLSGDKLANQEQSENIDNAIRFLIMGDWGTQTSPKNNNNNDNSQKNNNDYNKNKNYGNSYNVNNNYEKSDRRKLAGITTDWTDSQDDPDAFDASYDLLSGSGNHNLQHSQSVTEHQYSHNNGNGNNNGQGNGNGNSNNQKSYWAVLIAKAMSDYASVYPVDFLIALGDNFYNNGVTSTSDGLWTSMYGNVYNYESLQVPWYAIFGNHDYGSNKNNVGSLDAQVQFSDGRWHAGYCYMNSYTIPNTESTLEIVFVDTTLIAPQYTYMTSTSAGVSAEQQAACINEQLTCMEGYLAASNSSFLIVAGHYPLFSTGKNGPGDMSTLVETLLPYFEKYHVDAYLCGHDHRVEHLQYTTSSGGTMDFIISGAAGKPDEQLASGITSAATSYFASATGAFAFASVTADEMIINIVDYTGAVLYSMTRSQSRVWQPTEDMITDDGYGQGAEEDSLAAPEEDQNSANEVDNSVQNQEANDAQENNQKAIENENDFSFKQPSSSSVASDAYSEQMGFFSPAAQETIQDVTEVLGAMVAVLVLIVVVVSQNVPNESVTMAQEKQTSANKPRDIPGLPPQGQVDNDDVESATDIQVSPNKSQARQSESTAPNWKKPSVQTRVRSRPLQTPAPIPTVVRRNAVGGQNMHQSQELRPSNVDIAQVIAETARKVEKLGISSLTSNAVVPIDPMVEQPLRMQLPVINFRDPKNFKFHAPVAEPPRSYREPMPKEHVRQRRVFETDDV